ncbi:MAG TPA: hypothetical protein PLY19_03740 [Rhodoglobus sp.]|nr:hypothetical protein [Rhodoglobus sp.]
MSEQPTAATAETTTPTSTEAQPEANAPDAAAQDAGKTFTQADVDRIVKERADRLYRQRVGDVDVADLKSKASKYDEAQEAAKTAEQRAADQAQRAVDDARKAAERADRAELGVEHGIGKDHLDLLGGGSREDMAARAERLAPLLAAQRETEQLRAEVAALREGKQPPVSARPVATLHPGASSVQIETSDDSYPAHWIPQRA